MIKDMSKIIMWHVKKVTILHRNVPVVCGLSYHLLGYRISQDSKIRFLLHVESYIGDWQFSESRLLASYVSRHTAMAYDSRSNYLYVEMDPPIFRFDTSCHVILQTCNSNFKGYFIMKNWNYVD